MEPLFSVAEIMSVAGPVAVALCSGLIVASLLRDAAR